MSKTRKTVIFGTDLDRNWISLRETRDEIGPEPNRNLTEWTDKRNQIMEPVNHSMYI